MSRAGVIDSFWGEYRFLSNFYEAPILLGGVYWPTVEHLFQAMKTSNEGIRHVIRLSSTPGMAKKNGRLAVLRPGWEEQKKEVMLRCLLLKFTQHPELAGKLRETAGRQLVEGNTWHDNYWGNCTCEGAGCLLPGQNALGVLLEAVRFTLS